MCCHACKSSENYLGSLSKLSAISMALSLFSHSDCVCSSWGPLKLLLDGEHQCKIKYIKFEKQVILHLLMHNAYLASLKLFRRHIMVLCLTAYHRSKGEEFYPFVCLRGGDNIVPLHICQL